MSLGMLGKDHEPMFNPNETEELMDMIKFVRDHFHMTILLIEHDMKKENAKKYVSEFQDFYIAGWSKILGL